jgi:phosphate transport system permease protein
MNPQTPSTSSSAARQLPRSKPLAQRLRLDRWPDSVFSVLTALVGISIIAIALSIVGVLVVGAEQSFHVFGWRFFTGEIWNPNPSVNVFGVVPFVAGTLITSAVGLVLAVPLALGSAIFITTQSPRWLRGPVSTLIELLAAIPSVIYGFWALYVLHPYMASTVEPALQKYLGWTGAFNGHPIGLDLLTAGVVLAIMIVPTVSAVSREALAAVPAAQREAALSLGATDWESTRVALLPYARSGIIGGIILGLGRALGETMAVVMVVGGADRVPTSLFSQGQTIASLIADELVSYQTTLQVSAILEAALVLMAIALIVNVVARLLVWRVLKVSGGTAE